MVAWSDADLSDLSRLADAGKSASVIGGEMHRSRNAILGKCFRMKIVLMGRPGYVGLLKDDPVPERKRRNRPGKRRVRVMARDAARMDAALAAAEPLSMERLPLQSIGFLNPVPWPHENGCRQLDGEPREFNWCNAPRAPYSSYCPHHQALNETPYQRDYKNTMPVKSL